MGNPAHGTKTVVDMRKGQRITNSPYLSNVGEEGDMRFK